MTKTVCSQQGISWRSFASSFLDRLAERETEALLHLRGHGLVDLRLAVTEDDRPVGAEDIDVLVAVDVADAASPPLRDEERVLARDEVVRAPDTITPPGTRSSASFQISLEVVRLSLSAMAVPFPVLLRGESNTIFWEMSTPLPGSDGEALIDVGNLVRKLDAGLVDPLEDRGGGNIRVHFTVPWMAPAARLAAAMTKRGAGR